jgi:hypothetical protein
MDSDILLRPAFPIIDEGANNETISVLRRQGTALKRSGQHDMALA